jgi:hypothetical protein
MMFRAKNAIRPPIFVYADDLYIFDSVEEAESYLEPVDVEPGEVAYDAEGRLLQVVVRGKVRRSGLGIDQRGAHVELVPVEDEPRHAEELRQALVAWVRRAEPGADVTEASTEELVERARLRKARQSARTKRFLRTALVALAFVVLAAGIWWSVARY